MRRTPMQMAAYRQEIRLWERHYRVLMGWKDMSLAVQDKFPAVFGHHVRKRDMVHVQDELMPKERNDANRPN